MEKIKVLVSGCNVNMGHIICDLIQKSNNMEVIAGFDYAAREFPTFPVFESIEDLKCFSDENYIIPDVIIDCSSPKYAMQILEYAQSYWVSIIITTTGFSNDELESIIDLSYSIPVCASSYKYSVSENTLKQLISSNPSPQNIINMANFLAFEAETAGFFEMNY